MDEEHATSDREQRTNRDCEGVAAFVRVLAIPLGREIASELRQTVREALACGDGDRVEDLVAQLAVLTAQRDDLAKDLAAAELNIHAYRDRIAELERAQRLQRELAKPLDGHAYVSHPEIEPDALHRPRTQGTCQECRYWHPRTSVCRNERSLNGNILVGAGNTCSEFVRQGIRNQKSTRSERSHHE